MCICVRTMGESWGQRANDGEPRPASRQPPPPPSTIAVTTTVFTDGGNKWRAVVFSAVAGVPVPSVASPRARHDPGRSAGPRGSPARPNTMGTKRFSSTPALRPATRLAHRFYFYFLFLTEYLRTQRIL